MKKHEIPKQILDRVEAELVSDEDILWVGQPHPTRFLTATSTRVHALLAMALGTEIALLFAALLTGALTIMGILFALLVMTAIAGSIAQQVYWAKNTIYAISNQRALIIRGNEVETFGKRDLQSIVKKTHSNGRGDIIFRRETETRVLPSAYGLMLHRHENDTGFLGIENPAHVELLLLNTFSEMEVDTKRLVDKYEAKADYDIDDDYEAIIHKA